MARRHDNRWALPAGSLCGVTLAGTLAASTWGAPQAMAQSGGASHDIRMVVKVPVICGIRGLPAQVTVTNSKDNGKGNDDKFQVRCNTPYALALQLVGSTNNGNGGSKKADAAPATTTRTALAAGTMMRLLPAGSGTDVAVHRIATGPTTASTQNLQATLRVAGTGEVHETHCILTATGRDSGLCFALAGPGDNRLGASRAQASLLITGSIRTGSLPALDGPQLTRFEATEAGPLVELPLPQSRLMEPVRVAGTTIIPEGATNARRLVRNFPVSRVQAQSSEHVALLLTGKF